MSTGALQFCSTSVNSLCHDMKRIGVGVKTSMKNGSNSNYLGQDADDNDTDDNDADDNDADYNNADDNNADDNNADDNDSDDIQSSLVHSTPRKGFPQLFQK